MNEQSGEDDLFIVAAVFGLFARPTKAFVIAEAEFLCGRFGLTSICLHV